MCKKACSLNIRAKRKSAPGGDDSSRSNAAQYSQTASSKCVDHSKRQSLQWLNKQLVIRTECWRIAVRHQSNTFHRGLSSCALERLIAVSQARGEERARSSHPLLTVPPPLCAGEALVPFSELHDPVGIPGLTLVHGGSLLPAQGVLGKLVQGVADMDREYSYTMVTSFNLSCRPGSLLRLSEQHQLDVTPGRHDLMGFRLWWHGYALPSTAPDWGRWSDRL